MGPGVPEEQWWVSCSSLATSAILLSKEIYLLANLRMRKMAALVYLVTL